jgi:hypothetical protein
MTHAGQKYWNSQEASEIVAQMAITISDVLSQLRHDEWASSHPPR